MRTRMYRIKEAPYHATASMITKPWEEQAQDDKRQLCTSQSSLGLNRYHEDLPVERLNLLQSWRLSFVSLAVFNIVLFKQRWGRIYFWFQTLSTFVFNIAIVLPNIKYRPIP